MAFLHLRPLRLLSLAGVWIPARGLITLACIMGCVALPYLGVIPEKLPGPPEHMAGTCSQGLVSFPHSHLCRCGGNCICFLGAQDLLETSPAHPPQTVGESWVGVHDSKPCSSCESWVLPTT